MTYEVFELKELGSTITYRNTKTGRFIRFDREKFNKCNISSNNLEEFFTKMLNLISKCSLETYLKNYADVRYYPESCKTSICINPDTIADLYLSNRNKADALVDFLLVLISKQFKFPGILSECVYMITEVDIVNLVLNGVTYLFMDELGTLNTTTKEVYLSDSSIYNKCAIKLSLATN